MKRAFDALLCEALLRALKHGLRDRKERGEGTFDAVHNLRQQKLQDHNCESKA